jgi:hypothetical protein
VPGVSPGLAPRRYGLAANGILAAEVVTADSQAVRAGRKHNPDLPGAIRGASTYAPARGKTLAILLLSLALDFVIASALTVVDTASGAWVDFSPRR